MEKPVSVNLRLPPRLHERVAQRAQQDIRSLNAEIQWLLTIALDSLERDQQAKRND